MGPFIFVFGLIVILVACGIATSVYLYTHGAVGDWRFRRFRRTPAQASTEDNSEDDTSLP